MKTFVYKPFARELLAMKVNLAEYQDGKNFLTENDASLQVGVLNFAKGVEVKAHTHKDKDVSHIKAMEVIIVISGEMEATIYDRIGEKVTVLPMFPDDVLVQFSGGHGFAFSENTKIFEVKCGPYQGKDGDKVML